MPCDHEGGARARETAELRRAFAWAAILIAPLLILEMASHRSSALQGMTMAVFGERSSWLIQFMLASIVLFGPGRRFFRNGTLPLLRATPDMNWLIVVGTGDAYGYSVVAPLRQSSA